MDQTQRKRRKWDVPAPAGSATTAATVANPFAPPKPNPLGVPPSANPLLDDDVVKRAKLAAAAIASKYAQDLAAKGVGLSGPSGAQNSREVAREVVINDAPGPVRFNLTKKPVQDDIASRTKTVIVTKGRYYPPGARVDENEKALHLRITPSVHAGHTEDDKRNAVDAAAAEIQSILQGKRYEKPAYNPQPAAAANGAGGAAGAHGATPTSQLFVGINAPPEFGLANRLRGPGDQYLKHIGSCGAFVVLRGAGSGMYESPEPLHFSISAPTQKQLDTARNLAQDLLGTVKKEFDQLYPHYAAAPPPTAYAPPGSAPMAVPYPPPGTAYPPNPAYPHYPPPHSAMPSYPYHPAGPAAAPAPAASQPPPVTSGPPITYPPPSAAAYPPPSYPGTYPPPTMPGYPAGPPAYPAAAQYPYGPPPAYNAPPGAYPPGAYPPPYAAPGNPYAPPPAAGPTSPAPAAHEPAPAPSSPPRRRFRESKDDHPQAPTAGNAPQPVGYAQSYPQQAAAAAGAPLPAQAAAGQLNTSTAPAAGVMGPPPPRIPMGPPPPKLPAANGAGASSDTPDASATGEALPKLVDYEGDD